MLLQIVILDDLQPLKFLAPVSISIIFRSQKCPRPSAARLRMTNAPISNIVTWRRARLGLSLRLLPNPCYELILCDIDIQNK